MRAKMQTDEEERNRGGIGERWRNLEEKREEIQALVDVVLTQA